MAQACQTESLLPTWITIGFGALSFIMLTFTIVLSLKHIRSNEKYEGEWEEASACKKVKLCARDVKDRKSVYLPMISHLADTVTDIASVVEFWIVANTSSPEECGVNVFYLFGLSVGCMVVYRVISVVKIYGISKSFVKAFLQLLDFELYNILYYSHKWGIRGSSSPQRLISVLEAVFEAAPQSVIQLIYLLFTNNPSPVVIASAAFSFISLTSSLISDDAKMLGVKPTSVPGVSLYLLRVLDVPGKLLLYTFLWYFVSGYACAGLLLLDTIVVCVLMIETRSGNMEEMMDCLEEFKTDVLLTIVAVPLSFEGNFRTVKHYWCWSVFETIAANIIICVALDVIAINDGISFSIAHMFKRYPLIVVVLWLYCSIGLILKWFALTVLIQCSEIDFGSSYSKALTKQRANLNHLVEEERWADVIELLLFKGPPSFHFFDKYGDGEKTLLTLIMAAENKQMFDAVFQRRLDKLDEMHSGGYKEGKESYESALVFAYLTPELPNRDHYIESILNSPQMDFEYLQVYSCRSRPGSQGSTNGTALYHLIKNGNCEDLQSFVDCMRRVSETDEDWETKTANVLNCVKGGHGFMTAFIIAAFYNKPVECFQMLYDAYPSESKAQEGLLYKCAPCSDRYYFDAVSVLVALERTEQNPKEVEVNPNEAEVAEFIKSKIGVTCFAKLSEDSNAQYNANAPRETDVEEQCDEEEQYDENENAQYDENDGCDAEEQYDESAQSESAQYDENDGCDAEEQYDESAQSESAQCEIRLS